MGGIKQALTSINLIFGNEIIMHKAYGKVYPDAEKKCREK